MSQDHTDYEGEHTEITNMLTRIFAAISNYGNIIQEIVVAENNNDDGIHGDYSTTSIADPLDRYWE